MDEIVYTAERDPDLKGAHGRAWKHDVDSVARRYPDGPPAELTAGSWVVYAPYAHPVWHSYAIAMISLKHIDGLEPPVIHRPDATHELLVIALDPAQATTINDRLHHLHPINFAAQIRCESEQEAAEILRRTVQLVIDGELNPDTDYLRTWIARFGDSNIKNEFRVSPTSGGGS